MLYTIYNFSKRHSQLLPAKYYIFIILTYWRAKAYSQFLNQSFHIRTMGMKMGRTSRAVAGIIVIIIIIVEKTKRERGYQQFECDEEFVPYYEKLAENWRKWNRYSAEMKALMWYIPFQVCAWFEIIASNTKHVKQHSMNTISLSGEYIKWPLSACIENIF